ncbi:hypothetical protein KCU81_g5033, partial [Aureobasidium melanogenum]|uniref:F-box domain-containing protein n=1 Tax=Aureobasidium melanogenum (strain CBS 110374) TaxID=1043003 RepID=A0A074VIX0_AURM1
MDPPTSFSSLPPELVSKICRDSDLQKNDLVALRLTSKSQGIHLSASKEFAEFYFRNIDLVYTRYSLQVFVEICKHPILGSAVREIQLSYARFKPDCFEKESKDQFDHIAADGRSEGRHEYLDNIRRLVTRCDEEENLKRSNNAEDLLAAAFTALSQWNHPLKIAVSSVEDRALGRSQIYSPSNLGENSHWECDILGTVNLLCHSATRRPCAVQALQIKGAVWDNLVDSSSDSLSSLAQISELELHIWPTEYADSLRVAGLDSMAIKLLESTVYLKTLDLESGCSDDDPQYLRSIFTTMLKIRLENITLARIDLDQFRPFENRLESLRRLELFECGAEGSLGNVLPSIQKNFPRLEYLWLSRGWGSRTFEFHGVREVSDGIDELIQSRLEYRNNLGMAAL